MSYMFSSINGKNQQRKQYDCDNSIPGPPDYHQNFSCYILSNIKKKGRGGGTKHSYGVTSWELVMLNFHRVTPTFTIPYMTIFNNV